MPSLLFFDGARAATSCTRTVAAQPVDAPLRGSLLSRCPEAYNQVINQFGVGTNPRYAVRDSSGDGRADTFCNIFVWDVTRAMSVELPHWVTADGTPSNAGQGTEVSANALCRWLGRHGEKYGWRRVDAATAQYRANQGQPTVVVWENPNGPGHVAVVRPGTFGSAGPAMAQAGQQNFNQGAVGDGFGTRAVTYWTHL